MKDERLAPLIEKISADPSVVAMLLHGSQATGLVHPYSDIDLAFYVDETAATLEKLLDLHLVCAEALESDQVDVLLLNQASQELAYQVLRKGIVLYLNPAKKAAWVRFRHRVTMEYLDYLPTLEMHYAAVLRRIQEGRFGG